MLSIIGCLLVALVWGPHMPPGRASATAASQSVDFTVLATIATPVVLGVLLYFGWALTFWRKSQGRDRRHAAARQHRIQATWIVGTAAIVLALAVYGTVELIVPAGAGAGQGPQPIFKNGLAATTVSDTSWAPNSKNILQVQVIGQQWAWTYRYPQFGGFETTQLALPVNQPVEFNVTSLDVIHSFWAYTLGVKADANPGVNNIAYTTPTTTGDFQVRCAELCGIWHGAMFDTGEVLRSRTSGVDEDRSREAGELTKLLPPYALTYDPTTLNLGKVNTATRPHRRGRRLLQPGGPGTAVGKERGNPYGYRNPAGKRASARRR